MGISIRVNTWLRDVGHDTLHLSETGLHMLADSAIIYKASEEDRIILTADMDFGHLLATHQEYNVSVIQFRVTDFKAANIIDKLTLVFDKFPNDAITHFLITAEDNRSDTGFSLSNPSSTF